MNRLIVMIFIIAWILCAGSSRKAPRPPPPQAPRLLCRCQVFLLLGGDDGDDYDGDGGGDNGGVF